MPIYEFYCPDCNTVFNFYSRTVNPSKKPSCPKCKRPSLERMVSAFATLSRKESGEEGKFGDFPVDERKVEQAVSCLANEADKIDENNPVHAAQLMRKLAKMTGLKFGNGMEEAISRLEKGEDPEKIETELGDVLEKEDPFNLSDKGKTGGIVEKNRTPKIDTTLYDL